MCEIYKQIRESNRMKSVFVLLTIIITATSANTTTPNPSLKLNVEINPKALEVILHAFDHLVVFFHSKDTYSEINETMTNFEEVKHQILKEHPTDHSFFGYVNMSDDFKGSLKRFGKKDGFLVLNRFT